jgi:hypothetical protein
MRKKLALNALVFPIPNFAGIFLVPVRGDVANDLHRILGFELKKLMLMRD